MKKMTHQEKLDFIYKSWDNEEIYFAVMPDREMNPFVDIEDYEHDEAICFGCNPDWLAWELELLD
jgi:hypothetical protein